MALTHHDASLDNERGSCEPKLFGAKQGSYDDVASGLELTVTLHHDAVTLSTSLFRPWTTTPAVLGWLGVSGLVVFAHRRWPLLALVGMVAMVVGGATAASGVRYDPTLRSRQAITDALAPG